MSKILKLGIIVLILIILGGIYYFKSNNYVPSKENENNQYQTEQPNKVSNQLKENNSKQDNNKQNTSSGSKDNALEEAPKELPVLIDLGAGTCIPCKMMQPVLDEVKKEYEGKAIVKIIDVYEKREEAMKYGIRAIPTQIFFDASGKEIFRHEGFFSKEEITAQFKEMGIK